MFKYRKDRMQQVDIKIRDITKVPNDADINSARSSGFHILSSQAWSR